MQFYVYAIHTDGTENRRLGAYDNFRDAKRAPDAFSPNRFENDYFITIFQAENDVEAHQIAEERRERSSA
jgi:hypothetical protein